MQGTVTEAGVKKMDSSAEAPKNDASWQWCDYSVRMNARYPPGPMSFDLPLREVREFEVLFGPGVIHDLDDELFTDRCLGEVHPQFP